MVQERLELETSKNGQSGSRHASLMASSRRRKGTLLSQEETCCAMLNNSTQGQHFYPQNTTNYRQALPSWCVRLFNTHTYIY